MLSFHNDPAVKARYVSRVHAHALADNIIQGTGWENGKGCAIGCTLENYDHERYPVELGLPVWLARLEDSIFEHLSNGEAKAWPERFLQAVPVGVDVEIVRHKLAIRRMDRLIALQRTSLGKHGAEIDAVIEQVVAAIEQVRKCHEADAGGTVCAVSADSAYSAAYSAYSAAYSAYSAAWQQEANDLVELLANCQP